MNLSDRELLQRVWIEQNPLTTTELETELATRFDALLEWQEALQPLLKLLEDKFLDCFEAPDLEKVKAAVDLLADWPQAKSLLDVLNDFDLDNDELLRERLVRLRKLDDAMADLVEPLQVLSTLATTE